MSRSSSSSVLVALLAAGVGACEATPVDPTTSTEAGLEEVRTATSSTQGAVLAALRAATARYHLVETAIADGYVPVTPCIPSEGIHYAKFPLLDGTLDPVRPEQLLYEPLPDGSLRLAGILFLVPASAWDPFHSEPPMFGQQPLVDRRSPPFGAPFPNYALFVWSWLHNPEGIYVQLNPRLSC